jgi:hypothetical protein
MITYHKDLGPIAYLQKRTVHAHDGTPEFEADIRLMLKNCYTFNTPHILDMHTMGNQLEEVFQATWSEKPSFAMSRAVTRTITCGRQRFESLSPYKTGAI